MKKIGLTQIVFNHSDGNRRRVSKLRKEVANRIDIIQTEFQHVQLTKVSILKNNKLEKNRNKKTYQKVVLAFEKGFRIVEEKPSSISLDDGDDEYV